MEKDTLKEPQDSNDALDDALCLVLYEIAKGQRDTLNEDVRELAQAMMEISERETGYLPDVIMLLEVYCAFHPDVPYAVAREKVLKATESVSEGGLNPIQDDLSRKNARNQTAALVFGDEFEQFGDFSDIAFQWLVMRFVEEHPEVLDLEPGCIAVTGGCFDWMEKRFAAITGK